MSIKYNFINILIVILIGLVIYLLCRLHLLYNTSLLEGLTQQIKDLNSPLYSHTVNLPLNNTLSCKNFCGPNAQCAITREQCSTDIDCFGCKPIPKNTTATTTTTNNTNSSNVDSYDATGKLGQQGLQYSPLTTGFNGHNIDFAEIYPGSKNAQIVQPYQGVDNWKKSFNAGLELYNKKRESADKYNEGNSNAFPIAYKSKLSYYEPNYPLTTSVTGMFYETMPPAANASI
jgi:hypothetical protein